MITDVWKYRGKSNHHTIICFSEVQISFNTLFSIFVDYNSLFNVFTNGIIRRSNGFSRWWGN
ncbi:hypothetical protein AOY90_05790 [Escherichia coli]|nr:hypothetical protein AOY90_05790 [Escherichia coli]